ncbi:MAG: SPFH domain-containing protein [Erysipelotrichaceae bacterium]|nr:SPFH domain-containing protein [Erysipelotrichaceae bacterium]
MGLIRAALSTVAGTLSDQWKEYFVCDSLDNDVLMVRGIKRNKGGNYGKDNVITNGSGIVVADGQCMLIVEKGAIVDMCAEPGEYTYDMSSEPSFFCGTFKEGIRNTWETMKKRFAYAGDTATDQRIYYINTKEITDNKFGTSNPVPFRAVDDRVNLDLDVEIKFNGVYSYKITDPMLFYKFAGNVEQMYTRDQLDTQMRTEFVAALQPAFGKLSDLRIRPNQLVTYNVEIENAMNEALSAKWGKTRGIEVVSVAIGSVQLLDQYKEAISNRQIDESYTNPAAGAAAIARATAEAMKDAANNTAGAMNAFMATNAFASNSNTAQGLYGMASQQPQTQAPAANSWTCACGTVCTGNFCPTCGASKPHPATWTCACGTVCTGNFCPTCGAKKPQ